MTRTAKFLRLPAAEKRLLLSSLAALVAIRTALWTLNFPRVQKVADAMSHPGAKPALAPPPERIAWAVATASRVVPDGANCLLRALATGVILKRYGYPSELKIGVMKSEAGNFQAHAWLESAGSVVIGDFQLDQYVPLRASDTAAR
ncbi:MAG TPA: lasso peptide biosynthesis B2 protein [Candidatus Acidoferrales bacterium]|nr:lasso peptide biosynthesis B2 protein [Candidatus Acidoferrales bacterium]